VDLLAKAAFRSDAHAIAHQQHADHQFRIDRGAAGAAVERLQGGANAFEIEVLVNASQLMAGRDVIIEVEVVEQPSRYRLHAHHRRFSCKSAGEVNHAIRVAATAEFFNTIGGKATSTDALGKGGLAPIPDIAEQNEDLSKLGAKPSLAVLFLNDLS
jgi:hypothetical protein